VDVALLLVPYDSAQRGLRMGAGPEALVRAGLADALAARGHDVAQTVIEPPADAWRAEIGTAFALAATVAHAVRGARAAGRFPLVLAGNCITALGVAAGLEEAPSVLWCDAHGDYNTPETTTGGFLDGMALATLTGGCWTALAARVPGFAPVDPSRVWLLGARDVDPLEEEALRASSIRRVDADAVDAPLGEAALALAGPRYLHLDLDVLDPRDGRANGYAAPDGVRADALLAFCASLGAHARPAAATLSAYDPAHDADGRAARVAIAAVEALLATPRATPRGA
jgi:arginase